MIPGGPVTMARWASADDGRGQNPEAGCPAVFHLLPPAKGDVGDPAGAGPASSGRGLRAPPAHPEPLSAGQHDGHHDDVQVVDRPGGQKLADSGRASPMRRSRPAEAWSACASASAGLATRKRNVVQQFFGIGGRGWWVRTKTGV